MNQTLQSKHTYQENETAIEEHHLVNPITVTVNPQRLESLIKNEIKESIVNNFKSKPIIVNGKLFQLVDKEELANAFGISSDTVDKWSDKGFLPKPFDPEKLVNDKNGKGRKVLKWDLYECLDWYRKFR